ncbi:MAG: ABC transporter substrate-binding protein [Stenotrophomonas sp.]
MNIPATRLSTAVALMLALAACQKPGGSAPALSIGDSTTGEITSSSRLNYNDGSRHQGYNLAVKAGQAVSLELGGALNGTLSVFDGQTLLATNSRGTTGYEGESGGLVNLAFKAPKDGTYLVAVNSMGPQSFGPYKLNATAIAPYNGEPLGANSEANDWLIAEKQEYPLKVAKAGIYTIRMDSSALDAYLSLSGKGVDLDNDDGGEGTNARLTAYLQPGDYVVTASAIDSRTGSFKLGVTMTEQPNGLVIRDGSALTLGNSIHGMIDSRGRRTFTLQVTSPRQVQFDAIADNFDSTLRITGPGVNEEDDDGGNGTNARLRVNLVPGTYTVVVSSLGNQQGIFELETTDLGGDSGSNGNSNQKSAATEAVEAAEAATDAAAEATN